MIGMELVAASIIGLVLTGLVFLGVELRIRYLRRR